MVAIHYLDRSFIIKFWDFIRIFLAGFLMVLSWIIINWTLCFVERITDDEILRETIRRINRLIAQGELYEAYWLVRIWDILELWDWRETLEDAEALVNQLIFQRENYGGPMS